MGIIGGDFETPGLWDEFRAERVSDIVHGGSWSERLVSVNVFGVQEPAYITQVSTGLTGEIVTPRIWIRPQASASTCELWVIGSSTEAGPIDTFYDYLPIGAVGAASRYVEIDVWTEWVFADIELPCDNPTLGFYLTPRQPFGSGTSTIRLDDVAFKGTEEPEADVAVMLLELPLRAMLATLQTGLNAEIAFVATEANDGLAPHAVEKWYCWKRKDLAVDRCLVEVYEIGGTVFNDWNAQVSTWLVGQRVPLHSEHRIVVAVLFANRGLQPGTRTLKNSEMRVLAMRYATAVIRTIRNSPNLGQTAIYCEPGESAITYGLEEPEGAPGFARVEVPFLVRVNESSSGETNLGGGPRPSAILEG